MGSMRNESPNKNNHQHNPPLWQKKPSNAKKIT